MSMFDAVIGAIGKNYLKPEYIKLILAWIEQQGGVSALIEKFNQAGLGSVISSWLSNEPNEEVQDGQIQQVFGLDTVKSLAGSIGLTPALTTSLLAQSLPQIIDLISSKGDAPGSDDLVSKGLDILKGKLFS
ncbi:YidB family protein [Enterobacteriaceae bacterium H20N1]|uniref:YidB family protein n=1 Tax=Dryocola boscaweniae TaxID=2925397 RepID=A0A9X2WBI5_9ENTR|nr:YidB family protein [Dryocola boscaweniae]MCT4703827.1 YidB family protein [Dryocola boscaweniae]MCT4717004.1 YidB family protein [Dryocola boscaweniae]MCT4720995.1 YidB family protein [Dryocola boscaweniae]